MKRFTCIKIVSLLFALACVSQSAYALKCIAYMSLDGGEFMCAAYAETSPCEGADQQCIPVPPKNPAPRPADAGIPTGGPSYGGNTLSPEEMSCKQVNQQIVAQKNIINQLNVDIAKATAEIVVAERNLADSLSESAVNVATADKAAACKTWSDMQMTNPDLYVCTEPLNNRPPKCTLRKLTSSEQKVKNSCDAKTARASSLGKSRTDWLQAQSTNKAVVASAERKKAIASANLTKLRDAKDAKPGCQ